MARWLLPVPVPPTSTALRCWARKSPPASSRTSVSLIGVPVEDEVVELLGERQLGDGELVTDRTRLLLGDLGLEQVADDALRFVLALDAGGHDLIEGGPCQRASARPSGRGVECVPSDSSPEVVVAGTIGDGFMAQRQRSGREDRRSADRDRAGGPGC